MAFKRVQVEKSIRQVRPDRWEVHLYRDEPRLPPPRGRLGERGTAMDPTFRGWSGRFPGVSETVARGSERARDGQGR